MMELTLNSLINSTSIDPLDLLKKALATYDRELAKNSLEDIISKNIDPTIAMEAITQTMRLVGDAFGRDELFLPDLLSAADTMESIMPRLEEEIKKSGKNKEMIGKVVLGTVKGDVHTIGKTMVGTLLKAGGFEVYDVGVDVSAEKFMEAIRNFKPEILAMSALLSTTAYEQRNIVESLKKEGIRKNIKIMVGGGAITQEFADEIGADGYESTAPKAVNLARKLLNK